ncbi:hypothetical protein [Mycolicibacter minnesotensis]
MKFWGTLLILGLTLGTPGVLSVVWFVASLSRGEYLTAATVFGIPILVLGTLIPPVIAKTGNVRFRGEHTAEGTLIRPDRRFDFLTQAAGCATLVSMGLYAIFTPLGKVNVPVPPGMGPYFMFTCTAGVIAAAPSLWAIPAHGGVHYLRLSPEGFEIWQGLRTVRCGWDELRDIRAWPPGGSLPLRGTIYLVCADGQTRSIVTDGYTPGGHAVRVWMRFYWTNPDHRAELTDHRALERLGNLR